MATCRALLISVVAGLSVYVDYRVTTEGDDGSVSENPQVVVDRLVEIAHEVLDDSPHCEGFTVRAQLPELTLLSSRCVSLRVLGGQIVNSNDDGLAGNPSFFQDPDAPWVHQLEEWSGLKAEVANPPFSEFATQSATQPNVDRL